jgi:2-amino-4-hydroxy-6-hydroxymethyldihydropteridine diphosphokinase
MSAHLAYVGIGANRGDRLANVDRALDAMASLGAISRRSSLYRTEPWGDLEQPWFLNLVALLETRLTPRALLDGLHAIERDLGRVRGRRWGPREIDLDLLTYDDREIEEADLRVPHPRLRERAFVLVPLAEIDAAFESSRDALHARDLAGVVRAEREKIATMSGADCSSASERVRALARFLAGSDAVRVRIERDGEEIEIVAGAPPSGDGRGVEDRAAADAPAARVDAIKADLVGIFHVSRPVPVEGDLFEGDRELGYIEALGIRTPVHSMGAGRLVAVATPDGSAVEYGQPLFLVARGR